MERERIHYDRIAYKWTKSRKYAIIPHIVTVIPRQGMKIRRKTT